MSSKVEDRVGTPIEEGDTVFTKIRGGKREGKVSIPSFTWLIVRQLKPMQVYKIDVNEEDAKRDHVKHPPKVL